MSALGALLIQPQRLERSLAASRENALLESTLGLLARFVSDSAAGGQIAACFEAAALGLVSRIEAQASAALSAGLADLEQQLAPVAAFVNGLKPPSDIASSVDFAKTLLLDLASFADGLTLDHLRALTAGLLKLLEHDLGISNQFITDQLWALVDDIATRIEAPVAGESAGARDNRRAFAATLRELEFELKPLLVLPTLDAEEMARRLFARIPSADLATAARKAACISAGAAGALDVAKAFTELVPFVLGDGTQSPATAHAALRARNRILLADTPPANPQYQYSWYLTWLRGDKARSDNGVGDWIVDKLTTLLRVIPLPWLPDPKDSMFVDATQHKAFRTNLFGGGFSELTDPKTNQPYPGSISTWTDLPMFQVTPAGGTPADPHYSFKVASTDACEEFAFFSAVVADFLRWLLNVTSIEEGDFVTNSLNAVSYASQGIFKLVKGPFDWWLCTVANPHLSALWWILTHGSFPTIGGSFEGIQTNGAFGADVVLYLILAGTDGVEQVIINGFVDALRDALLSTVTLLNDDGPVTKPSGADTRPANRLENRGVVALVGQLLSLAYPAPAKTDYGYTKLGSVIFPWMFGYTTLFSLLNVVSGVIVSSALSRTVDWQPLLSNLVPQIAGDAIKFIPGWYLKEEGDTLNGTYNGSGTAYAGYPDHTNSPYTLPYEQGKSVLCVQGNQGFVSHNADSGQIYAYDFVLAQDDPVLAARSGTVVDWFDFVPNDSHSKDDTVATGSDLALLKPGQTTQQTWNFVVIRHDLDDSAQTAAGGAPVAPRADQDRSSVDGAGNPTVITSYGVYGHARTGSVRDTFSARGVSATQIVGQRVQRGQQIMRAGNTGNSAVNHLHMDVRSGAAAPNPLEAPSATTPVRLSSLSNTLPFVFKDVSKRFEVNKLTGPTNKVPDGVPTALNYYTSTTVKV